MNFRIDHLRTMLASFSPFDLEEAAHRTRMLALCDAGEQSALRERYLPGHFTASAFILAPERDALLLILHKKLGLWLQPGGHVEPTDSDIVAAARREAEEETSLRELELLLPGPLDLDIHRIPQLGAHPPHEHFDVRFLFQASSRAFEAASDAKAARWVPLPEISLSLSDRSVMRAVDKLLR